MGLEVIAWLVVAELPKVVCIHFTVFVYFQIVYISSPQSDLNRPRSGILMVRSAVVLN
jgi:hypothetical protein